MPEIKKKLTLEDKARIFLTPTNTHNLFPEVDEDLYLGRKPAQIAYNLTKLLLTHDVPGISSRPGITWDEPGHTILVSTQRQGAELISLALQLQGFQEKGIDTTTESGQELRNIRLERHSTLYVDGGVILEKNIGGPPWENFNL